MLLPMKPIIDGHMTAPRKMREGRLGERKQRNKTGWDFFGVLFG